MRRTRTTLALAVAAALVLPAGVMAQQPAPKPKANEAKSGLSSGDRKFVMDAARDNMAEVELGKMAMNKGATDSVKQYGRRMVDDHGKAQEDLKGLADSKQVTLPTDLNPKQRQVRDRLAKLNGTDFDRAYANEMVSEHKKDVAEFKREAKSAKDADVKNWAGKTLPTLEDHLKQAQGMQAAVKGAPRAAR
jgi:putative membrane protein